MALITGDTLHCYIGIPSGIRTRMEIVGGDGIRCVVKDIIQKEKNLIAEVNQKSHDEVVGYWHELYNPPEDARRYGLRKNHCARLIARSVVRVARRLKSRPSR